MKAEERAKTLPQVYLRKVCSNKENLDIMVDKQPLRSIVRYFQLLFHKESFVS